MVDVIGPSTIGNSLFPAGGKRCIEEILVVAVADAQVTKVVDDGVDGRASYHSATAATASASPVARQKGNNNLTLDWKRCIVVGDKV